MTADQLRALAAQLLSQVDTMSKKIQRIETVNEQLTYEIALLNLSVTSSPNVASS
ncbi:hypothetical protein T266_32660 [Pseudomonas aeruginosa VRFPA05]|nr:hypothetical protein T266_32660 [Pseudomonas aeruginosa VRFPA05]VFS77714.1 transposase family IS66 [Pseudomonas aeruginosa]